MKNLKRNEVTNKCKPICRPWYKQVVRGIIIGLLITAALWSLFVVIYGFYLAIVDFWIIYLLISISFVMGFFVIISYGPRLYNWSTKGGK